MRQHRILILAALSLLFGVAAGQSPVIVTNKKADRTIVAPKGIADNTARFFPQVVEVKGQLAPREVDNQFNFKIYDTQENNTLALGQMSSTPSPIVFGPKFPAIGATGWVPPDPDLAVGPNHIVATVNVAIAFFKKDGTKTFQQELGNTGFFSGMGVTNFVFDPKCFYDSISKRFFVVGVEQDGAALVSKVLVAVSDDSDPNGTWFKYRIEAKQTVNGSDFWLDYPGFGFNKDALMITGNMFGFAGGFNGIQYIVIPKAPLLSGGQPTVSYFSLGGGSAQVMRTPDASLDVLYGVNWTGLNTAMIHAIRNLTTTPTLTTVAVPIPSFRQPAVSAQSTGGHVLDSLDGRLLNCQVRGGRLYTAHTVQINNNDNTNASRWYEFNLNGWPASGQTPAVRQSGNVGIGNNTHFFMPAIGVNGIGDIALVYTRSSPSICADFVVSGRKAGDALGVMGAPKILQNSLGTIYGGSANRWGDYFGCQVDPVDDRTFWGIGMVAASNGNWQTVINSFKITTPVATAPTGISKLEGGATSGGLPQVLSSNNQYFQIQSVPVYRLGQVTSAIVNFLSPANDLSQLKFTFESSATLKVTASLFVWSWTQNKWIYIGAAPQSGADKVTTLGVAGSAAQYINSQKQMKILIRSIMPYSTTGTATQYPFKIDQVSMSANQ